MSGNAFATAIQRGRMVADWTGCSLETALNQLLSLSIGKGTAEAPEIPVAPPAPANGQRTKGDLEQETLARFTAGLKICAPDHLQKYEERASALARSAGLKNCADDTKLFSSVVLDKEFQEQLDGLMQQLPAGMVARVARYPHWWPEGTKPSKRLAHLIPVSSRAHFLRILERHLGEAEDAGDPFVA